MNLREAARAAAREIRAHRLRSLLSFSAISVGAASLLYTLAQTRGMRQEVAKNLELMGPGALAIEARRNYVGRGLSKGLTIGDARALRAELPGLFMVSPTAQRWPSLSCEGKRIDNVSVAGATTEWRRRNWVYSLRGRFLSEKDQRGAERVCVVIEPGGWVKKPFWLKFWGWEPEFDKLASRRDLLGKRLRVGGHDFIVVGALKPPPRDKDPRWDPWGMPSVLVPLSSYGLYLSDGRGGPDAVDAISIDTGDEKTLAPASRRIAALLKARHRGEEDFEVKNQRQEIEDSIREQDKYVAVALILGIVAILSGGIGMLNVTLAAVYSRVREIGIRRALGAERADVLALFIAEAAMLGAAGGVAGVLLGLVGIDKLAKAADRDVADPAWWHAAAMIALSSTVASLFAAYPAWIASRMDPVEALREEA